MKAIKSVESKYPTLLQSLEGWGVHIYKWGLQIKLNPKLLLQPYRMDKNVQKNVKWICFVLEKK